MWIRRHGGKRSSGLVKVHTAPDFRPVPWHVHYHSALRGYRSKEVLNKGAGDCLATCKLESTCRPLSTNPSTRHSPDDARTGVNSSDFLASWKPDASCGQLPAQRAARTVAEGLFWPFSLVIWDALLLS